MNQFDFEWDSEEQRKGYLSFLQWAKRKNVPAIINPIDLYFIQKDHESTVYYRELLGDQVRRLENQIRILQAEIANLKQKG